ncbi:reverse transcriptase domain-containing protein [Tanacetum coccineum]|uniref:Reverse transcriptase domain-containing protein n=1 Tax=Tanacetum coccineum TaxID=301880 RepID=A0ABQ5H632_9ASTR
MPFGLRNVRATYQRLVDKAFHKQIGRNLEVYVDDLVIKSHTEDEIGRRRDVLRIQSQHQGAESMYRQGRHGLKSSIPKMLERRTKVKQKARKPEQTTKAEEAFKQMKQLISELPMLTAPMEKEELIVYLAAAKEMGIKRSGNKLYINGKVSVGLGVIKTGSSREAIEMEHELGEYAIHYRARVLVKGQILADFIVERPEEDSPDTLMEVEEELPEPWILFTDGFSCIDGSGAGLILTNPEGIEFTYALRFRFDATNNESEYEALIAGLRIAKQIGVKNLQADVDSRLVANQVNGMTIHSKTGARNYAFANTLLLLNIRKQMACRKSKSQSRRGNKSKAGHTPFSLTYETKAVIPAEIGMPTLRTTEMDLIQNNEALEINLDLLEERREQAVIREENSKAKMEKYYNSKV